MALNTNTSIVDYLKSTGKNSSYANRSTLAAQNKINNYTGTAQQNTQLLNALRASQTKEVTPKVVTPKVVTPKVVAPVTPTKVATKPVTTGTKVVGTSPVPTTPAFDQTAFLKQLQDSTNSMYDAQQASQLAALQAQQNKALGQLNQQKTELAPQYQGERNQADVVNAQNVQRLRELMASQGLSASGENVTAQTAQNNQRLNSLNALNLQEQQANNDINRQINDVNDPAQAQAIMNDIASQRSQALLDAYNRANDVGYQRSQDSLTNARADATLTGKYNGQNTLDYTNMLAQLTGKINGQNTYQANQDAIHNKQVDDAAKAAAKQQAADNTWRQYQYTHMSATDKAQLAQNASQFGEDKAWELYQLKYNGELQKSTSQAQINAYTNP